MRNWLHRLMYGRNGPDQLSLAALILGLLLTIVAQLIPFKWLQSLLLTLNYVCFVYFFFRVISRNIYKRQEENRWYLSKTRGIREGVRFQIKRIRQLPYYKYFRCPHCHLRLRAPRGKGKIRITCQNCGTQFDKKT